MCPNTTRNTRCELRGSCAFAVVFNLPKLLAQLKLSRRLAIAWSTIILVLHTYIFIHCRNPGHFSTSSALRTATRSRRDGRRLVAPEHDSAAEGRDHADRADAGRLRTSQPRLLYTRRPAALAMDAASVSIRNLDLNSPID